MAGGTVRFQAQNPAISGDPSTHRNARGVRVKSGWSNCTAFVAAMGAQFDSGVRLTGTQVRRESSEPVPDSHSPGLSLTQVAAVLRRHGVRLIVRTPIDFDRLDALRLAGHAVGLQLSYAPIQRTRFTGDPAFDGGHIVLWLPNGDVYDPLHDHRRAGIATAPVQMPRSMLREAAGTLQLGGGRRVGLGRAYAGIFASRHPAGGAAAGVGIHGAVHHTAVPHPPASGRPGVAFRVVVPVALVRSSPGGVPGKGNVVGRLQRGARVAVFGTTKRGQPVSGNRIWHQVDRGGRRFMHSSVIDPAARTTRGLPEDEGPDVLATQVDDPDAPGPDEDNVLDGPFDADVDSGLDDFDDLDADLGLEGELDLEPADPIEPLPKNDAIEEESANSNGEPADDGTGDPPITPAP